MSEIVNHYTTKDGVMVDDCELTEKVDEYYKKEVLENIFGSEDLFDVMHVKFTDADGMEDFLEVPCEVIVRRIMPTPTQSEGEER